MKRLTPLLTLFAFAACCLPGLADEPTDAKDRVEIKPKAEKYRPADSIDFAYELDLQFDSLSNLGKQIEAARKDADPVALQAAANLLKAAESVSASKKASLTSTELTEEATTLAKLRANPAELELLAAMSGNKALKELAAALQEEQAKEEGESEKDLHGELHVFNDTHEGFYIYANGRYLGYLPPHGQGEWHVHNVHYVDARNRYHRVHQHIHGHVHHYDFVIDVHHHD